MPRTYRSLALVGVLLIGHALMGQYHFENLNSVRSLRLYQGTATDTHATFHPNIRPLSRVQMDTLMGEDHLAAEHIRYPEYRSGFLRKLFNENLVDLERKRYAITINPVVNLGGGYTTDREDITFRNDRGLLIQGRIGQKFTFSTAYIEGQGVYPQYVQDFRRQHQVVPGFGIGRGFGDRGGQYFTFPAGEISYNPNSFFTFTAGQGKNFFGHGYRSMLLSDAAYNYPFFRIETTFWKIRYVNLWAQLYDIRPEFSRQVNNDNVFGRKFLSSHYLSINLTPRWNLSFFEAVVIGDTAQQRGMDPSFFNPIIFYRPVEFQVGSGQGNAMIGMESSYRFRNKSVLYGQFILDEFVSEEVFKARGSWVNKFGWQLGLKKYDFIWPGLYAQVEYNTARPYTFAHRKVLTNYGHYNQPLAHPWGANFQEFITRIIYQKGRWEAELMANLGRMGLDTNGSNWGSDIYQSYLSRERDLNNETTQGATANVLLLHVRGAWLINPRSAMKLEAGLRYRHFDSPAMDQVSSPINAANNTYFYVGIRTEFLNEYWDF